MGAIYRYIAGAEVQRKYPFAVQRKYPFAGCDRDVGTNLNSDGYNIVYLLHVKLDSRPP